MSERDENVEVTVFVSEGTLGVSYEVAIFSRETEGGAVGELTMYRAR